MSSRKLSKKKKQEAFIAFQQEFKRWQHELQCDGYTVHFKLKKLDEQYASIEVDEHDKAAWVDVSEKDIGRMEIDDVAKHEACHLFLNRLIHLARARYVRDEEIHQEWERLASTLEKVL